ncbi:MAG TPA: hypothetical protein VHG52_10225, partial [Thermomicrobiales bacterium]|nr:hypothetical protein [Thermomicrobiales bacterium]
MAKYTRRVFLLGILILMLPLVAACGGGEEEDPTAADIEASPTTESAVPTQAAGDSTSTVQNTPQSP